MSGIAQSVGCRAEQDEKGGYAHFMLKEIYEQPRVLRDILNGRIDESGRRVVFEELDLDPAYVRGLNRVFITACGTAYHAGMTGKYLIEKLAGIPVEIDVASEFCCRDPLIGPGDLLLVVSQSGETADTRAAMREAHRRGARIIAITNVVGSSISREADHVIYTHAGPEIAIASTKAYTAQLAVFYLLAVRLAGERGTLPEDEQAAILQALRNIDSALTLILGDASKVAALAERYAQNDSVFFLGRNLDYGTALEGNLKLKETSYVHAEAFPAGEFRHGPLALVSEGVPVVVLATQPSLFDKAMGIIRDVRTRGGRVITITLRGQDAVGNLGDHVIYLPPVNPLLAPIPAVVPLQLFAYYAAVARGCPVDNPRNLTKAVTVE